jgi:nicotinamide mononucleotide (NMN) deamidase PncC
MTRGGIARRPADVAISTTGVTGPKPENCREVDRANAGYFFQSAPRTNPMAAAMPKVAMGCSFIDLSI